MHLYFYAGQQLSDLEQLLQTLDALIAQVVQAVARVVTVQTFALAISKLLARFSLHKQTLAC